MPRNAHGTCVLHEEHGKMLIILQCFSQFSCPFQFAYLFVWKVDGSAPTQGSCLSTAPQTPLRTEGRWVSKTSAALPHQQATTAQASRAQVRTVYKLQPHVSPSVSSDWHQWADSWAWGKEVKEQLENWLAVINLNPWGISYINALSTGTQLNEPHQHAWS